MDLIIPVDAKELIRKEINPVTMSKMVLLVERGYKLAREATRHLSFLDWDLGKRHEGYLRPIAINYLFKQDVEKNRMPFSVAVESNRNKSHKFLLFGSGSVKMTISQVQSSKSIARPAFFRSKLQLANQVSMKLFKEDVLINEETEYYLLLTYNSGGEKPSFVNLGMPNGEYWIDKINLMEEPRLILSDHEDLDREEVIVEETFVGLRKFAEEVEGSGGE